MEEKLKIFEEATAKFQSDLSPYVSTVVAICNSVKSVNEAASSSSASSDKYEDYAKKLQDFRTAERKVPIPLVTHYRALTELITVFQYGSKAPGKERKEFIACCKDSCTSFLNKLHSSCPQESITLLKDWRESILAMFQQLENAIGTESAQRSAAAPSGGMNSLFSSINQGSNITKNLRKVDDSQKTHKNPELRGNVSSTKQDSSSSTATSVANAGVANLAIGDPLFKATENMVEAKYLRGTTHAVTGENKTKAYGISCVGATFNVENKINVFTLENSSECVIIIKAGMISSVELISCYKCHIQCNVSIPTITIEKSSECTLYIKESDLLNPENATNKIHKTKIITANCNSINIHHIDDDLVHLKEEVVPSIFCSTFNQETKKWEIKPQDV